MTDQGAWNGDQVEATPTGAKGWLDDFWTVALVLPCLAAFVPGLQDVVSRGFQIIGQDVPAWYLAALAASLGAAFGRSVLPGGFGAMIKPKV